MTLLLCRCKRPQPESVPGIQVICTHCGRTLSRNHYSYRSQRNASKGTDILGAPDRRVS